MSMSIEELLATAKKKQAAGTSGGAAGSFDPIGAPLTTASVTAMQQTVGNGATAAVLGGSAAMPTPKSQLARPAFTGATKEAMVPEKGDHRRHVVMSHKMGDAIWAYHMNPAIPPELTAARRKELQDFVGGGGTLRTEMGLALSEVHNSLGNLFLGDGGENTAIGFAVRSLEAIADAAGSASSSVEAIAAAKAGAAKWGKQRIFGFAAEHKAEIVRILTETLDALPPSTSPAEVAGLLKNFADSCAHDVPYEEHETDDGVRDDGFPPHMDRDRAAALLKVSTMIQAVIDSPANPSIHLYGPEVLGFLQAIAGDH